MGRAEGATRPGCPPAQTWRIGTGAPGGSWRGGRVNGAEMNERNVDETGGDPGARPTWRSVSIALGATALVAVLFAIWLASLPSAEAWAGLSPGDCFEYCEASDRCGALATRDAIQQPANTWSNLAFFFVGALALATRWTPGSVVFAFSCSVLGAGSLLFHATVTREFQWLDVAGMYLGLAAVAARALHDGFGVRWRVAVPAWAIGSSLLIAFKWRLDTTLTMLSIGAIAAAGMVRRLRRGFGSLAAALLPLGAIVIAYAVREVDVRRIVCDPASLFQGHALWHLLSAASLYLAFRFFDSGRSDGRTVPGVGPAPRS